MRNYKTYIRNSFTKSFPWKLTLVVLGLFFIKKILSYFKTSQTREDIENRQNEISDGSFDYNIGITKTKAKELSNNLLDAFNYNTGGALFGGTDKSAITAVFEAMHNNKDYKKVYKEFGLKLYNGSGLANETSFISDLYDKIDLTGWLRSELDFLDFNLNSLVKQKITNSGLTY
jgi:hypothetical protein